MFYFKFCNFIFRPAYAYSLFETEVDAALLPDTDPAETEIQGWEKEEDLGIHFVPADPGNEEDPLARSAIYVRYWDQNRV